MNTSTDCSKPFHISWEAGSYLVVGNREVSCHYRRNWSLRPLSRNIAFPVSATLPLRFDSFPILSSSLISDVAQCLGPKIAKLCRRILVIAINLANDAPAQTVVAESGRKMDRVSKLNPGRLLPVYVQKSLRLSDFEALSRDYRTHKTTKTVPTRHSIARYRASFTSPSTSSFRATNMCVRTHSHQIRVVAVCTYNSPPLMAHN